MRLLSDLVDLVLPRECAGCAEPAALLCPACATELAGPVLGLTAPDPRPWGFPTAVAGAAYGGVVRGCLLAHKERGRTRLVEPLGALLGAAVLALRPPGGTVLVPVPSAPAAVRARGHDHARRLATVAARRSGTENIKRENCTCRSEAGLSR